MTKPTGNPVGRPKTKEYSTLLARVPQDLVDRVKRYKTIHRLTIADLIRDGLEWRITEGDPHSTDLYDTNNNGYSSNTDTLVPLAGMDLTPDMFDVQELSPEPSNTTPADDLEAMPLEPVDIHPPPPPPALDYDATKYTLGKLCPRAHAHGTTGQSLLRRSNRHCLACDREKASERQKAKHQAASVA